MRLQISLNLFLIIGIVSLICAIVLFIVMLSKRCDKNTNATLAKIVPFFAVCSIAVGVIYTLIYNSALEHGAFGDFAWKEPIDKTIDHIRNGVLDQSEELPEDLSGKILIIFKYGCPDCEATYDSITDSLEAAGAEYYFVSSRSARGKEIVAKYFVEEVPSGVYVSTGSGHNIGWITECLYVNTGAEVIYLKDNMDVLINEQNYERNYRP